MSLLRLVRLFRLKIEGKITQAGKLKAQRRAGGMDKLACLCVAHRQARTLRLRN
jgi:hypothetical protein